MAARPIWQGHLRLSLVTCPVALFNATTTTNNVSFNLLHKDTHRRIKMVPHEPELGPVERADLVKGYEFKPGQYVIVTPKEIEAVRLPSTKTIDIEQFVEAGDIDRIYWENPYYLVPQGGEETRAYGVIQEAMARSEKIALGRLVMHNRERIVGIEPRGKGLLLTTLRAADEIRAERDFFGDISTGKPDKQMLEIAEKIIEQQVGEFQPAEFVDRYEDALRELIKQKQKGKPIVAEEPPEDTKVIDLMDALKKSLSGQGGGGRGHAKRVLSKQSGTKPRSASTKARPKKRAGTRH
ncbi:MAG: Ku protein [Rhodospirillaceae bacterium]